jgi:hypothetical protein
LRGGAMRAGRENALKQHAFGLHHHPIQALAWA